MGVDLEPLRFDEEHGIFVAGPDLDLPVGSWLRMVPGYAPATVNMYDCYYVIADDRVIDVWPVFPVWTRAQRTDRGPLTAHQTRPASQSRPGTPGHWCMQLGQNAITRRRGNVVSVTVTSAGATPSAR